MKVKTIPSDWLSNNSSRLDSNPYLAGAFEARMLLHRVGVKKESLYNLTKRIFHAGREGRTWVTDTSYGTPFLGSTDILESDLSWLPLLSKRQIEANPDFLIDEGWTLITRSGTVGRMVYARADMRGLACSEHVMRIVPNQGLIKPGYLYAFLSSKFGVPQVLAGEYGAVVRHIEPEHIKNLQVPIPPKSIAEAVHHRISAMGKLRTESAEQYQRATQVLFEAIQIPDIQRYEWLSDTRTSGFLVPQVTTATLRALNFVPRYRELDDQLRSRHCDPLGTLCDPNSFGSGIIFKRIDSSPEFGVRLVGQRNAFQVRPDGRWISKKSVEGLGLVVPPGTTMIAAHGTLGEKELYCRSAYVTQRTSEYAFSGDFVRCIPLKDKVLPGYLFAFLRSQSAFRMLRCISIGSKQQAPHPTLLWNLPIPRLANELEHQIHDLVQDGAAKFDLSLQLEEEAWEIVENWIEEEADAL